MISCALILGQHSVGVVGMEGGFSELKVTCTVEVVIYDVKNSHM